jgi:CheY-like chemotaxis protein
MERIPFPLDHVIDDALIPIQLDAKAKGLSIDHTIDPLIPNELIGDPDRLRQVIINLLRNAVKFTEKGKISLSVALKNDDVVVVDKKRNQQLILEFSVRDTGIGIPRDKLEHIFDAFYQLDGSAHRIYGGAGLGLGISKGLVEQMQGDIWAESNLGEGSKFYFTAAFDPVTGSSPEFHPKSDLSDKTVSAPEDMRISRVLLAEDDPTSRECFTVALHQRGINVTAVTNGQEVLEKIAESGFDIILMDVQMPGMDGIETTRRIRRMGLDIPIIALTAHAFARDHEKCFAAGMNQIIVKPIEPDTLLETVYKLLGKEHSREALRNSPDVPVLSRQNGDKNLIKEVDEMEGWIGLSPNLSSELLRSFYEAMDAADLCQLEQIASQIKTEALRLGLQALADDSFRLILAARKEDTMEAKRLAEAIIAFSKRSNRT